jgi:flagellar biosynthesis/type III secretory pathway chaperone
METLKQHQQICDELHALILEENRHLQAHRVPPNAAMTERKRLLLGRLDTNLAALRATGAAPAGERATRRTVIDATRARVLQILQLDRENEQLLLRFSLSRQPGATETPSLLPAHLLRKIYQPAG